MFLFTVFILSLFLTIALVPVFKRLAFRMHIMDVPDERKVHVVPMPKTGGISIAMGAFIPMLLWVSKDDFVSSVLIGSIIIVVFGLVDDIRPLSAKLKILPQIAAALIVIFFGGVEITCLGELAPTDCILPWFVSVPLTLLVILGVTNAINLADGLDGLAGGISMLSFILIVFLAYQSGNTQIAIMAMAMVGGIAGFLRFNTHPAVLFMGDAGSQLLGFLSIIFAIVLTQANTPYSKILSLPLIGFPILDTLTVMVERIAKKRSPFSADKNHFHHRLLRFGFFHTEAVLSIYIIQACFIAMALIFRFYSDWVLVSGFLIMSSVILLSFYIARVNDWEFRRDGSFDTVVKKRLKVFKEKNIFIRICFGALKYGFPLLLAFQIMIPRQIPIYLSIIAICLIVLIGGSYYLNFIRFREHVLRFATYLIVPLLVYLAETDPALWIKSSWLEANNIAFIGLVLFVVFTMNLTRRIKGFKITPLDILVFIVILVFPNLPSMHLQGFDAGITLAKVLVLFFSFDVLIGELRGHSGFLAKPSICILAILAVRGFIG
ncbi:MAG: undecaprenyl/decaprenyl-phosphate alpha-N-acetylglucosaminyl 1-phosphate transferase [Desulfobacula sp.]|uniref:glycosyltransferase family 4 protein n=1 Tax=Desulfobacula sp. TaxID=2593537 RepID=UPI0025C08D52|nr:MraY family glycosyltransferase [Desulfobacula sp.]MCD4719602.1 undecaprenyl/decaprenyl-phosphate alpha-N-acetylglucosaminyl 1-phosphate transferase [Desulfobacula sp.]